MTNPISESNETPVPPRETVDQGARVLTFGPRALGMVLVKPRDRYDEPSLSNLFWGALARAQYQVLVPPGMAVRIEMKDLRSDDDLVPMAEAAVDVIDELHLLNQPITSEGFSHLAGQRSLRLLDLYRTRISSTTLLEIAGMSKLEWLSLTGVFLGPAGARRLAVLPPVKRLSLRGTSIGTDEIRHIVHENLTWLSMADTDLTDRGLRELAEFPALETLAVNGTGVTADGVADFWARRPDVELFGHG